MGGAHAPPKGGGKGGGSWDASGRGGAGQGKGGAVAATGNRAIDTFVAQWGLDSMSLEALCRLEPRLQERVIADFLPPNPARANQMFMGFLKSVVGRSEEEHSRGAGGGAGRGEAMEH